MLCKDATKLCENSALEREIKKHFTMLTNVLALHKADLLKEVELKANKQSISSYNHSFPIL
jgi:hypothetical protein